MNINNHWGVFLSNKADKYLFIQHLLNNKIAEVTGFAGLKGALFSAIAIKQLIEEEEMYDWVKVSTTANRHLRSLSSGEQKKTLLAYLLLKKPSYIIADDPFDNLDMESQNSLLVSFQTIACHTPIIQLINRYADCLPFINKAVYLDDANKVVLISDISGFIKNKNVEKYHQSAQNIPTSDNQYNLNINPLIHFKNITVKYEERTIVRNIDWEINAGEFWHLIGPNGSGKTTLLSLITGDNPKGYGQDLILFGKRKGTGETVWSIKKNIGYFTSAITDLFSRHTNVEQMIVSGFFDSIGLYTKPSARQLKLASQWLVLIDMLHLKKKLFHLFSLGQQRMILIARAMVKHPPLLILDEPTVGLDDDNALLVISLINKMANESKTAILYVSHRTEKGLKPKFIFELTAHNDGSTGRVSKSTEEA